ncbi:MAG: gamma-glutamyltransferase family protein, partial [Acidimicrobiia bacterium]
ETPVALNSSGRAGSGANADELRSAGLTEIPQRHPAAVTVPGCVDGWLALHARWGSLEFGNLLEPAIRHAAQGFPANREMAGAFAGRADELLAEPSAADMYIAGRPPIEGTRIIRSDLAETLRAIGAGGRAAFYSGRVGEAVSAAVDGMITLDDLAAVQAEWVDPVAVEVFGRTGWTVPPNSQGYISLLALAVLERLGMGDPDDPLAWHFAVEAYRQAAADRNLVLADPSSMTVDPIDLVSPDRIAALTDRIDADAVSPVAPPADASGGTAYMCVVDEAGMGVSLIQSNFYGIGSGRSVTGTGFLLHDRGRGFNLRPDHPNELKSGKRPLHTLSPTIWTHDGRLDAVLGTRGGHNQPQLVVQLAAAVIGRDIEPGPAMALSRWAAEVPLRGDTESRLDVEPGTSREVVEGLERRGHTVTEMDHPQSGWGPMSLITLAPSGLRIGAADPRVDTAAAAAG